jgi:hypothetical protein
MDMSKVQTLDECLSNIQSIEKACKDRYKEPACKNIRTFYLERCYKKFESPTFVYHKFDYHKFDYHKLKDTMNDTLNDTLDYSKFENNSTCSGLNTLGGNTLNRIIKSPSPPSL